MAQTGQTKTEHDRLVQSIKDPRFIKEELGEELVVFDRASNKAHLLDARSAAVFRASADGAMLSELEPLMDAGSPEKRAALVRFAVLELERVGLVVTSGRDEARLSRRSLLKTLGTAASLPIIVSIVAPTPAAAATAGTGTPGSTCTVASDCGGCVGLCLCKAVGGSGSTLKCCIADDGVFGDVCSNNNDCCCPDLECSTGAGPMTCVIATMGRSC